MREGENMFRITLFDNNIPSGGSGVISYYCEDIDKFAERWLPLQFCEDTKERFLRSKNGEMVTDYYSNDPSLNIVQEDKDAVVYFQRDIVFKDKWLTLHNGYNYPTDYHFDKLLVGLKYIRYEGDLLRLATYKAYGICYKNNSKFLDKKYCAVACFGNRVLAESKNKEPLRSDNLKDFKDKTIEFIAYSLLGAFEDMDSMKNDFDNPYLPDKLLDILLCDILGDAG